MRATLGETLRAVLALTVPAAAMLILLGRPLVQSLYQRGAFDTVSTDAVLNPLRFYALGLVGHSCLELAARAFFAQQDTLTPLLVAVGSALVNILLAILLMNPLGAGGLALANSLAVSIEVVVLLFLLGRRWKGAEGQITISATIRIAAATLVMSVALTALVRSAHTRDWGPLGTLALGGVVGSITYIAAGWVFGVRVLREALKASRLTFVPIRRGRCSP
jgi:putative peptidoglycan lipid II flippase